jgi:hypothetical protein
MHLYFKHRSLNTFGLKDIHVHVSHVRVFQNYVKVKDQGLKVKSLDTRKGALYNASICVKYQSPNAIGSKDITKVKFFSTLGQSSRSRSQGENFWYTMKGLFMKYLCVKYQMPVPHGSKDIARVKFFSLEV